VTERCTISYIIKYYSKYTLCNLTTCTTNKWHKQEFINRLNTAIKWLLYVVWVCNFIKWNLPINRIFQGNTVLVFVWRKERHLKYTYILQIILRVPFVDKYTVLAFNYCFSKNNTNINRIMAVYRMFLSLLCFSSLFFFFVIS